MLHPDGIKVFVRAVATNEPYKEHEGPNANNNGELDTEAMGCFIEFTPGQHIAIVTRLHSTFQQGKANAVRIKHDIDNSSPDIISWIPTRDKLPKDIFALEYFDHREDEQWMRSDLVLEASLIDEELFDTPEAVAAAKSQECLVQVSVTRVIRQSDSYGIYIPSSNNSVDLHKVSKKKANEGMGIHVSTSVNDRPSSKKAKCRYDGIAGPEGRAYNFQFRYRSRAYLERLGLILEEPAVGTVTSADGEDDVHEVLDLSKTRRLNKRTAYVDLTVEEDDSPSKRVKTEPCDRAEDEAGSQEALRLIEIEKRELELRQKLRNLHNETVSTPAPTVSPQAWGGV